MVNFDNVTVEDQASFLQTLFTHSPEGVALFESIGRISEFGSDTKFQVASTLLRIKSEKVRQKLLSKIQQPPEMDFEEDPWSGGAYTFRPSAYSELISSLCSHFKFMLDKKDEAVSLAKESAGVQVSDEYFAKYFTERLEYRLEKYLERFESGWQGAPRWDELEKDFTLETESYLAVVKALHERGDENPLEKIKDFSIVQGLDEGVVDKLWDIYEANWVTKTTPEYLQRLKENFYGRASQESTRFSVLAYKDEPIGFYAFTDDYLGEDVKGTYAGAFNIDAKFQRSKVGEIFLKLGLEEEKKRGLPIYAKTNPSNPMLKKYLEMGFETRGTSIVDGEQEVTLVIPARPKFATRQKQLPLAA